MRPGLFQDFTNCLTPITVTEPNLFHAAAVLGLHSRNRSVLATFQAQRAIEKRRQCFADWRIEKSVAENRRSNDPGTEKAVDV